MTASPTLQLVTKEIRALWLVAAASVAGMAFADATRWRNLAEPSYFVGVTLLGALAVGHEYSHGTIVQLLAQPVRRARLLLTKLAVLGAALVVLSAVAWIVFIRDLRATESVRLALLLLPVLVALCTGPWLTMLSRSPIGGAVFSFGLPGLMWSVTLLAYYAVYRSEPPSTFVLAALWPEALGLCAVGAVMTWRMFLRLEAIEGRGAEIQLPALVAPSTGLRRRSVIGQLVAKDIRLQQMTLAIAALYCVAWPVFALVGGTPLEAFYILSLFFAVLVALLAGSLSIAEERQLGTFDSQSLLPVPASAQWAVKVAVALAFTLLLGIGVPYVFMTLAPASGFNAPRPGMLFERGFLAAVVAIMCAGLYVSSLATSGVRAVVGTAPLLLGFAAVVAASERYLSNLLARWLWSTGAVRVSDATFRVIRHTPDVVVGTLIVILVGFAWVNHRSGERAVGRIVAQVVCLLAFGVLFTVAMVVIAGILPVARIR